MYIYSREREREREMRGVCGGENKLSKQEEVSVFIPH